MPRQSPARIAFLAAAAVPIYLGCAVSDPIDIDQLAKHHQATGAAGADTTTGAAGTGAGPGVAGATGATGLSGNAGVSGTAGMSGTATGGNQSITSGQAGDTGNAGAGGTGGNDVSGQAGSGGDGGATGLGGTTGSAGRGGTTGFAGRGGTTGAAGRGGTTGAAGRGGTTGAGGGSVDGGTGPDGGATQTFTDIYSTILVTYCSGSSCHSPGSQGGVSFASQSAAYTAVKSRVTAGNGTGSRFYMTVNSGSMPRGAAKLSTTNLNKIKTWIDQGALNN